MSFLPIGKKLINASARQMRAAYNTPIVSEKWLDNYTPWVSLHVFYLYCVHVFYLYLITLYLVIKHAYVNTPTRKMRVFYDTHLVSEKWQDN